MLIVWKIIGEQYWGTKLVKITDAKGEDVKKTASIIKEARTIGPPCSSKKCEASKLRNCARFTETDRQEIFKNFWQLEWGEKRGHVGSLVDVIPIKRSRAKTDKSTRCESHVYWLKLDGARIRVCRKIFLSTLGLAKKQVNNWIKKW